MVAQSHHRSMEIEGGKVSVSTALARHTVRQLIELGVFLALHLKTLGFGYAGTAFALRAKAAPLLRNE